jgi:hypothetical protein
LPDADAALLLVVVAVAVAAIGNRVAGGAAASVGGEMVDYFFTLAYYRFPIRSSADVTTGRLAVADWPRPGLRGGRLRPVHLSGV